MLSPQQRTRYAGIALAAALLAVAVALFATSGFLRLAALLTAFCCWITVMTLDARWHFRAFNVGVRIVALIFVVGGFVVAASAFGAGPALTDASNRATTIVVAIGVAGLGIGLLRLPAFRPDLGDSLRSLAPFRSSERARRGWWTGDPR